MANIVYYEDIQLVDNTNLKIGTGEDLELHHNATDSYIQNSTGNLNIINYADDKDIIFKSDDGSGGVAEYFRVDGGADKVIFSKGIRLIDNQRLDVGGATDGRFYHDGTDTHLVTITGNLIIKNSNDDGDIKFLCDDGSGGTTAYLTLDGGLGYTTVQKDIRFQDNVQLEIGDGRDLVIYSDGTNGLISNQNGTLYITQASDNEDIILSSDNGSGGTTAYLTLDGSLTQMWADKKLQFSDNIAATFGAGNDLQLYHNGSHSLITNQTGDLYIRNQTNSGDILFQADDGSGGDATYFYLNGGDTNINFQKDTLHPDNVKAKFGTSADLQIYHDGSNSYINDTGTGNLLFQSGGSTRFSIGGDVAVIGSTDFAIPQGRKLLLDGVGGHTYIEEESDGNLKFYVSGGEEFLLTDTLAQFGAQVHIPGSIYHIGDTNTYFGFHGNDLWRVVTGGSERLEVSDSGLKLGNTGATVSAILDEDNMASDSATALATQQSIKAYVDTQTTGVLTYQGTWNADTNSPTLSSGSGTPGYYYIVSVAGSTNLDGITDWAVGDWAVFSDQATDAWQKIDNTAVGNVSGDGTANDITMWSGSGTVTDAPIAASGNNITTAGDVTVGDELTITTVSNATGDPDKFLCISGANKVDYRTGAQVLSDIGAASSGSLASYLPLAGGTMTGDVIYNDSIKIKLGTGGGNSDIYHNGTDMYIRNLTTAGDMSFAADSTGSGGAATSYFWLDGGVVKTRFAKEATFADNVKLTFGNVTSPDLEIFHDGSHSRIKDIGTGHLVINATDFVVNNSADTKNMIIASDGGSVNLYYDGTQHFRTVSTGVEVTGSIKVTGDGSNAATLTETGSGLLTIATVDDLILDAGSDITLDAGGNDIRLFNAGVEYGKFKEDSSDLALYSSIQDKDIIFKGNDGGSTIDALTLDMSAGGAAIFNDLIYVPSYMVHTGDADTKIGFNTADNVEIRVGGNLQISASSSRAYLRYQGDNKLQTDSAGVNVTGGITATGTFSSTGNIVLDDGAGASPNIQFQNEDDDSWYIYNDSNGKFQVQQSSTIRATFSSGDLELANDLKVSGGGITLLGTGRIQGVDTVSSGTDAANKTYVDTAVGSYLPLAGGTMTGNITLSGDTNIVLDTSVSSTQSSGTIIKIGSHMSALVAGNIYYAYNSMGSLYWGGADADSSNTEHMLALSVGTDADVDGMLLNGIYHKASHGLTVGDPIYLSTTPMTMTNTAPSGANDYVRVLGYAIDSNHIYFCPDNTWVKISS